MLNAACWLHVQQIHTAQRDTTSSFRWLKANQQREQGLGTDPCKSQHRHGKSQTTAPKRAIRLDQRLIVQLSTINKLDTLNSINLKLDKA